MNSLYGRLELIPDRGEMEIHIILDSILIENKNKKYKYSKLSIKLKLGNGKELISYIKKNDNND